MKKKASETFETLTLRVIEDAKQSQFVYEAIDKLLSFDGKLSLSDSIKSFTNFEKYIYDYLKKQNTTFINSEASEIVSENSNLIYLFFNEYNKVQFCKASVKDANLIGFFYVSFIDETKFEKEKKKCEQLKILELKNIDNFFQVYQPIR